MSWGLRKLQRIWNIWLRWGRMCMCFWNFGTWSFPEGWEDMDKGTRWRCETWRHFAEMENHFVWLHIKVQIVVEAARRLWSLSSLIFLFLASLSFMLSQPNICMFLPQTSLKQILDSLQHFCAIPRPSAANHSLSDHHLLSLQLTYSNALISAIRHLHEDLMFSVTFSHYQPALSLPLP